MARSPPTTSVKRQGSFPRQSRRLHEGRMQGGRTVGVIGPDEKLGGSPSIGRQNSVDALIDVRREERIWKMSLAGLLAG